jgi:hypothetical protein
MHCLITFLQLKHYSYMFRQFLGHPQEAYIGICRCESSLIFHTCSEEDRYLILGRSKAVHRASVTADVLGQRHITVMHGGTQCNKLSAVISTSISVEGVLRVPR